MLTTPSILASYLYMRLGEQMPPELDEDASREEIDAQNAWFEGTDEYDFDLYWIARFIEETEILMGRLVEAGAGHEGEVYQTLCYDAAKATFDQDKKMIRTYFLWLYYVMYGRPDGSRWGLTIEILGPDKFVSVLRQRFEGLI